METQKNLKMNFQQLQQIVRYCMVGGINTLVTIIVMTVLAWLGVHYIIYTACGYITAFLVSFTLNLRFTFKVDGHIKKRLITFVAINLCNLGIVEGIQIFLIELVGLPHFIAITMGMLWYSSFGFLMNQRYVFHNKLQVI